MSRDGVFGALGFILLWAGLGLVRPSSFLFPQRLVVGGHWDTGQCLCAAGADLESCLLLKEEVVLCLVDREWLMVVCDNFVCIERAYEVLNLVCCLYHGQE